MLSRASVGITMRMSVPAVLFPGFPFSIPFLFANVFNSVTSLILDLENIVSFQESTGNSQSMTVYSTWAIKAPNKEINAKYLQLWKVKALFV
jgi:hypothetical protein